MKTVSILKIKRWIDDELINSKEKLVCGYCYSTQVYKIRGKRFMFCRACGKESKQ